MPPGEYLLEATLPAWLNNLVPVRLRTDGTFTLSLTRGRSYSLSAEVGRYGSQSPPHMHAGVTLVPANDGSTIVLTLQASP